MKGADKYANTSPRQHGSILIDSDLNDYDHGETLHKHRLSFKPRGRNHGDDLKMRAMKTEDG